MRGWFGESGRHSLAAKGVRSPHKRSERPLGHIGGACRGKPRKRITKAQAKAVGDAIGVDWATIDIEQFRKGMLVELEHGCRDSTTNVTYDDLVSTGKIAHAHLKESRNYYRLLEDMEKKLNIPKAQIPQVVGAKVLYDLLKGAKVKIYDPETGMQVEYQGKEHTER